VLCWVSSHRRTSRQGVRLPEILFSQGMSEIRGIAHFPVLRPSEMLPHARVYAGLLLSVGVGAALLSRGYQSRQDGTSGWDLVKRSHDCIPRRSGAKI